MQVAQQEAQRASFVVERARQERQQKIVQAEGEAEAATLISFCALAVYGCIMCFLGSGFISLFSHLFFLCISLRIFM